MNESALNEAAEQLQAAVQHMKVMLNFMATDAFFEQGAKGVELTRVQAEHGYYAFLALSERVYHLKQQYAKAQSNVHM